MKPVFLKCILLLPVLLVSNQSDAQHTINNFRPLQDLAGSWKMITKKGVLYEHWYSVSDSFLQNKSYRVNGKDSIPQETVQLKISNGIITYTSTVANQNNQQPVVFTLVKIENGMYVFENKAHDFPQRVSYQLMDKNTLNASISGTAQAKFRKIPFNFKREQ